MTENGGQRTETRKQRTEEEKRGPQPVSAVRSAPSDARSRMADLRAALPDATGHLIFWSIALLGLAADLWTKAAVFSSLRLGQTLPILNDILSFRPALNDGAAFGIASGRQPLLVGVSLVAVAAIAVVFLVGGIRRRIGQVALGLFVAGVCGNLWDRLFNTGCVRDFVVVDLGYWPAHPWNTFNVADALLCVAVGLLALVSLLTPAAPSQKPAPTQK
jgi:signal peptidase II